MPQNNSRPAKKPFTENEQVLLRNKAIDKIKDLFLPNDKILKIILIGSSVKGSFGEYGPPGFRNSLFSDFDFIFFVKDDYEIPDWLKKEPSGKPFTDDSLNLAYRNAKMVDDKYDIEFFFIREENLDDNNFIEEGEGAGIPLKKNSKIEHLTIFEKK
ncbi:hypothetical protein KKC88_04460 [Patescibacteria group bacterium]|nr:hypothetical protein [Patescibacteria group bacterium]MBU1673985.1 hypothetical protein [Patescibacteria group bacterium]MBU1962942.1 hypothetical protein [Patescibacteria group bacterium]